ncbi:zinc-binding dehydrogenase [Actinomadura vinacea]|uniref:Zinc-binding dehydrogenase n=1 Tax=Actinomadura vinacea TaxID=115336 RepID=A0ABN3JGD1_9ACTN
MRLIEAKKFGGPEVLQPHEAPDPLPGPGEVLIEVVAMDTLFVETWIRAGRAGEFFDITPPYVPGGGVAGTVTALGEGADPALLGARVATFTENGYADRVVVPADTPLRVPDGLADLKDAAALIHDGVTGMGVIEAAAVRPGEWVLIVGATGGMGILLVQLARAAGARVIAAARGERKLALARELGAEATVDYSEPGWAERARAMTGGTGAQVVLDGVGDDIGNAAFQATADGGRFSAHGATTGGFADARADRGIEVRGIQDVQYDLDERRRLLGKALDEAAAGRLRPVIGQTFPLERAADAHTAIESRTVIGKTLLLP